MHIQSKSTYILLSFLVLIAIGLRLLILLNTDHLDGDSVFRISDSYSLASHPFNLLEFWQITHHGSGCQVGYYFLNSLLMHFVDEPILVARLTSLIFGILVIIPYYLLIKLAFSSEIAWASILALALYPIHVQLSVTSIGAAGCLFFVIAALYFLMRYLYPDNRKPRPLPSINAVRHPVVGMSPHKGVGEGTIDLPMGLHKNDSNKRTIYFIASIIFTILATSFRLEAWFLVILFPLILLKEKRFKAAALFLVFSSLYILTTLYIYHKMHGNPFIFLRTPLFFNQWEPFAKKRIFKLFLTNLDGQYYGKYRVFIWIKVLFYTLSLPLTILGFWGIFYALKDKRQFVFFTSFWSFFIISTLRHIISNHYPFLRYSYIFAVFFIPFIFLGLSQINAYVCQIFRLSRIYKVGLAIIFILANIYLGFFSVNFWLKEMPATMKYGSDVHNLSDWMGKNINSGDIVISSFISLFLDAAQISNKFISLEILYNAESDNYLYNILNSNKKYLDKEIVKEIAAFSQRVGKENKAIFSESIHIRLLTRRGETQMARRIAFILNESDYNYLKDNFPQLFEKIGIKYNGFSYSTILPLY